MSQIQKIIKYLAIAFALFLTVSIISTIMYGFSFIGDIFNDENKSITEKLTDLKIEDNTLLLDIDVRNSNIAIKRGEIFKAETNNKYIKTKQVNNKLFITEEKHNWFKNNNYELIVYVPDEFIFDGISIETGASKLNVETLITKKLYLNLGAGKVDINNLKVLENADIDGGAGKIDINASAINNLDLDMGVGEFSLISKLTGKNEIDSGIGKLNLTLLGNKDDYQITLDKGIGSSTIDGKNINDDTTYGIGNNKLDIDGGIGSIQIKFEK